MLLILVARLALADACLDQCEAAFQSCAAVSAAGCSVAGGAAEKVAGKALGNVPGGSLLSKGIGAQAKAMCEEKLAPCRETQKACIAACPASGAAPAPQLLAAPTPLLVFGSVPKAAIWIDGKRAGTLPADAGEPYTSPPLTPGTHTIRVATADGASWSSEVEVVSGEINSVEVGPLHTEDERALAAALALEASGQPEEAIVALSQLSSSTGSDAVRGQADAEANRIAEGLAQAARQAAETLESDAALAWRAIPGLAHDRSAQRAAAVAWLARYEGTAPTPQARALVDEIDQLTELHIGPALATIDAYAAGPRRDITARSKAGLAIADARPAARNHGLTTTLEHRAEAAEVWVPAAARAHRYSLWRAEQRRKATGRTALILTSLGTATALPFYTEGTDLHGLGQATLAVNAAAGVGLLAVTERRHSTLQRVYGPAYPDTGWMPGAAVPLFTIGALQLTTFSLMKQNYASWANEYSCFGDCGSVATQVSDAEADYWDSARILNQVAINGWINLGLGALALGLHSFDNPLGNAHLSTSGLSWSF